MSLFNPIRKQYENLSRAMDDRKTISCRDASRAIGVPVKSLDHSLVIMTKRGYFGEFAPYVDDELGFIVLDRRYTRYAVVMAAVDNLIGTLQSVRNHAHELSLPRESNDIPDMLKSVVSGVLNSVTNRQKPVRISTQETEEVLIELLQYANRLRGHLLAYPEENYRQALADWLNELTQTVLSWESCLDTALSNNRKGEGMIRTEGALKYTFLAAFPQKLANLEEPPATPENDLIKNIQAQMRELGLLRKQLGSLEMQLALDRICDLLRQIVNVLRDSVHPVSKSTVNSLKNTYLPMIRDLTEQYIKDERVPAKGKNTIDAMNKTERVLGKDVCVALNRLLQDMMSDNASNTEAQATALKQKLKLDGLLKTFEE